MNANAAPAHLLDGISVVLLDIEGTTTPISFVHRVLFPYARQRLDSYLAAHWTLPDVQADVALLQAEYEQEETNASTLPVSDAATSPASAARYLVWLTDQDRKSPALKSLQGKIWQAGYESGDITSEVYADVPPFLHRWQARGGKTGIYSSGSVLAQTLLFRYSNRGDLTPFLHGYFDTGIGPKKAAASYAAIAREWDTAPASFLFISDVVDELTAAHTAGMKCVLSLRPGNAPQPPHSFAVITNFEELWQI